MYFSHFFVSGLVGSMFCGVPLCCLCAVHTFNEFELNHASLHHL